MALNQTLGLQTIDFYSLNGYSINIFILFQRHKNMSQIITVTVAKISQKRDLF